MTCEDIGHDFAVDYQSDAEYRCVRCLQLMRDLQPTTNDWILPEFCSGWLPYRHVPQVNWLQEGF